MVMPRFFSSVTSSAALALPQSARPCVSAASPSSDVRSLSALSTACCRPLVPAWIWSCSVGDCVLASRLQARGPKGLRVPQAQGEVAAGRPFGLVAAPQHSQRALRHQPVELVYMLYLAHWARKLSWKETAPSFGTTWDPRQRRTGCCRRDAANAITTPRWPRHRRMGSTKPPAPSKSPRSRPCTPPFRMPR